MPEDLSELLEAAKEKQISSCEHEEQRMSFAFGNTHFENERITRDMVREAAESLKDHGRS